MDWKTSRQAISLTVDSYTSEASHDSHLRIPLPPRHNPRPHAWMEPPLVPFEPRWEYKEIVREAEDLLRESELNALGEERWELAGVAPAGSRVHFYFKRERPA